jgi:hypothetical protein
LINIIPPVSFATSVPEPIAIPRSDLANAGASLIPSPTIATDPFFSSFDFSPDITCSFSCGNTCAMTLSIPSLDATALAVISLSPVSITTSISIDLSESTACLALSFIVSARAIIPAILLLIATRVAVFP